MIKVHCFVSCVCEVIKKKEGVDHRPYYFGVWDADFDVTEDHILTYHSPNIDHDFFKEWYERLYGIKMYQWYDKSETKEQNIMRLLHLIENKQEERSIMVMLDLSELPERKNKFHQKPFPHYVMIEQTEDADKWLMFDPDFRWEGVLEKERILEAIREPSVEGGYYFDTDHLRVPDDEVIQAYFNTCLKLKTNPLTDAIANIIHCYSTGEKKESRKRLTEALKQIPVLAIRKYAYEHAFAYFWIHLGKEEDEFEAWCDEIEHLVNGFTTLQYQAMRYALTGKSPDLTLVLSQLKALHQKEFKIKLGLQQVYDEWSQKKVRSDNEPNQQVQLT
ncbi:DUF6005 family protein [Alkalihalobacillus sp. 1P02AB]|uniref:DUF6005 family protein n=1 Tax=Alkalihalobacillus sp. 1P02AB TaxID=3132260 RepID=UPI0039A6BF8B